MVYCGCKQLGCQDCPELLPDGVEGGCGITATKVDDRWVINGTLATTIESGGGITVEDITSTDANGCEQKAYRLSVSCCDERVRVCAGQGDAKFLQDTLEVNQPLTMDVDCASGLITFGIDTSQLPQRTYQDCSGTTIPDGGDLITPSSLNNIIQLTDYLSWFDGPSFATANEIANPSDCQQKYIGLNCTDDCSPYRKQLGKLRLGQTFIRQQVAGPIGVGEAMFYILLDGSGSGDLGGVSAEFTNTAWIQELLAGGVTYNNGALQICRDGVYRVSMSGSLELTWGLNGVRVNLFKYNATDSIVELLETRYSPPSDPNQNGDPWPPHNYITSAGGSTGLNAGFFDLERVPFNSTDIYQLNAGDAIFFGIKVSSVIEDPDYDITRPAEFAVLGSDSTLGGSDIGVGFSVESIDDPCTLKQLGILN